MVEGLGDVLSLSRTTWRDISPGNEPLFLPRRQLEDEGIGTEDLFTTI